MSTSLDTRILKHLGEQEIKECKIFLAPTDLMNGTQCRNWWLTRLESEYEDTQSIDYSFVD